MVFFWEPLPFVCGPSPCTERGREKPGGQREWSSEGTASGPRLKRPGKGDGTARKGGEPKDLKTAGAAA